MKKIISFFSGYGVALFCLISLFVITFFATVEQIDNGLNTTINKYFSHEKLFIIPQINSKVFPLILPGAYWVCVLLTINLIFGGIIRLINNKKKVGLIIAHFSMVLLLISGAVSHHQSQHMLLTVAEGESSKIANFPEQIVLAIYPIVAGKKQQPWLIPWQQIRKHISNYQRQKAWRKNSLVFTIAELPNYRFIMSGIERHTMLLSAKQHSKYVGNGKVVNGSFLRKIKPLTESEQSKQKQINLPGCYLQIENTAKKTPNITLALWQGLNHPLSVNLADKRFAFQLMTRQQILPFSIYLQKFDKQEYMGSQITKAFNSHIIYRDANSNEAHIIKMNEPLRKNKYTIYQAQWAQQGDTVYSTFEVVKNPADAWPNYSLYLASFGLLLHFGIQLYRFIRRQFN